MDIAAWHLFEAHAGKKVSILHWGQPWYHASRGSAGYVPFNAGLMSAVRSDGAIPLLDWGSWD
jgi:hypothetical protein